MSSEAVLLLTDVHKPQEEVGKARPVPPCHRPPWAAVGV